jgi:hypothetical protein
MSHFPSFTTRYDTSGWYFASGFQYFTAKGLSKKSTEAGLTSFGHIVLWAVVLDKEFLRKSQE